MARVSAQPCPGVGTGGRRVIREPGGRAWGERLDRGPDGRVPAGGHGGAHDGGNLTFQEREQSTEESQPHDLWGAWIFKPVLSVPASLW